MTISNNDFEKSLKIKTAIHADLSVRVLIIIFALRLSGTVIMALAIVEGVGGGRRHIRYH